MILVTGATGRVGYHLLEALADARADVTAMVRVQAKAADLPGTPQHVVATFDDPPPAEVLRGFDHVFLLSPAIEEQAELETVFIDALVAAGHGPHVVKVAADGFADPGCEVRFMVSHRQIAAHLDATGLPATYLAPALYMEGLPELRQGVLDCPASIVHGWLDEVVPVEHSVRFAQTYRAALHLVDGDHRLHNQIRVIQYLFEYFLIALDLPAIAFQ